MYYFIRQNIINLTLVTDISFELTGYIKKNRLGNTRVAPSDVFLNDENIYQPDVYFVSNDNAGNFEKDGFHGAPDLVIEILSPGTEKIDKNEKLKLYETNGVKEYWLIDPDTKKATGYNNNNGRFELIIEETEKLSSKLLNTVFIF